MFIINVNILSKTAVHDQNVRFIYVFIRKNTIHQPALLGINSQGQTGLAELRAI